MAIQSFSDKDAEYFFITGEIKKGVKWCDVLKIVMRKLDMLHYAAQLNDLRVPPGNRLESLTGKYEGFYSIRINQQWRIIFRWTIAGPCDVEIIDYH